MKKSVRNLRVGYLWSNELWTRGVRPHTKCWANFPKGAFGNRGGLSPYHPSKRQKENFFLLSSLALLIKSKILSSSHPQPGPERPDPAHPASCFHIPSHLHPYSFKSDWISCHFRAFANAVPTAWNTLFSSNPYPFPNALKMPELP